MRRILITLIAIVLILETPTHAAEPSPVKSRIVSLGLFKNGLAVVKRILEVPGPGQYELDDVPEPVHGRIRRRAILGGLPCGYEAAFEAAGQVP